MSLIGDIVFEFVGEVFGHLFGAAVDLNLVMNEAGMFVELQGSGEEATFSQAELGSMLALGQEGIRELVRLQKEAIADATTASP